MIHLTLSPRKGEMFLRPHYDERLWQAATDRASNSIRKTASARPQEQSIQHFGRHIPVLTVDPPHRRFDVGQINVRLVSPPSRNASWDFSNTFRSDRGKRQVIAAKRRPHSPIAVYLPCDPRGVSGAPPGVYGSCSSSRKAHRVLTL